jgi:phage shock protein C
MTRRADWTVLFGGALLIFGGLMLAERVLGWFFFPLSRVLHVLGTVGWPMVLVGVGVLLVMRGRWGDQVASGAFLRSRTDRKIGGVLGGAAVFFGIDPSLLRLLYAVATVLTGFWFGLLLYVVAMIVVPEEQFAAGVHGAVPSAPPVPTSATVATPAPPAPPATFSAG